jgi:hypothetical protein
MKRHSNLPLLFLTALVMALSYLGGALAPPLRSAAAAGTAAPAAPAITLQQWQAVWSAADLLLNDVGDNKSYLPLVMR